MNDLVDLGTAVKKFIKFKNTNIHIFIYLALKDLSQIIRV